LLIIFFKNKIHTNHNSSQKVLPTFVNICKIFGPIYPGNFNIEKSQYELNYPVNYNITNYDTFLKRPLYSKSL